MLRARPIVKSRLGPGTWMKRIEASTKVSSGTGYHLQYLIEFQAITEGRGIDATTWNYKAKITPWSLFLTR